MSGTAFLRGGCRSFVSRRKTLSDVIGGETVVTQTVRRYRRLPQLVRRFRDSIDTSPRAFSASAAKRKEGGGCGGLVAWYLGMVKRQPVLTKSVTCSLIYTAADLSCVFSVLFSASTIARTVSDEPPPYDLFRTLRMASYGMVLLGPTLHMWFGLMSSLCPKQDLVSTFKKMAMGQAIYGPIMTIVFFSFNAASQGENSAEITARLKRELVPALFNGVMYWPVCDFITFRFTPLHLQPLVSNGFSYLWTIYMTYMANREKATPTPVLAEY